MAKQYNTPGQAKVVFRKSGNALKIVAAIAMLMVIPGETGNHPFDAAEAETEICEVPF